MKIRTTVDESGTERSIIMRILCAQINTPLCAGTSYNIFHIFGHTRFIIKFYFKVFLSRSVL